MSESRWRQIANQVIDRVVRENPGLPEKELRVLLSQAYPFVMRKYHPYKIWLSAVNEHFNPRATTTKTVTVNDGQMSLLEDTYE